MYLAQNLKYLREQKKLSQEEFAKEFGLSPSAIGMWERGSRKPDIEAVISLAEYFGVTLDELVLKNLRPPEPIYVSNLRYLRKKHGITQTELAKVLGFKGKSSVCAIETGTVEISVDNLIKLADYFNVTLDQLVKEDLSKEAKRL